MMPFSSGTHELDENYIQLTTAITALNSPCSQPGGIELKSLAEQLLLLSQNPIAPYVETERRILAETSEILLGHRKLGCDRWEMTKALVQLLPELMTIRPLRSSCSGYENVIH